MKRVEVRSSRLGKQPAVGAYPLLSNLDPLNAEGAAGVATVHLPGATSWAALLSRHGIRDGELILLTLKPSLWFILLSGLRVAAIVLLAVIATQVFDDHFPPLNRLAVWEAGLFIIAGRFMWSLLQWTSRLYVLTDMRIMAISGVFSPVVFECALRRVARTRLIYSARERLTGLGSVEIIPLDDETPVGIWQTVAKPRLVHEQIVAAINKAKQGCL
jgi:hypothetical protein